VSPPFTPDLNQLIANLERSLALTDELAATVDPERRKALHEEAEGLASLTAQLIRVARPTPDEWALIDEHLARLASRIPRGPLT
jgi:hypothetical protein